MCESGVSEPLGELLMGERRTLLGAGHHGGPHDDGVRVELAFHIGEVVSEQQSTLRFQRVERPSR